MSSNRRVLKVSSRDPTIQAMLCTPPKIFKAVCDNVKHY